MSVNFKKSYFTKHSLWSEAIVKSTWMRMVWHPQIVPEKVLRTSSTLIGTKFDALFSTNFCETIFVRRSSRVSCLEWRSWEKKQDIEELGEETGYKHMPLSFHSYNVCKPRATRNDSSQDIPAIYYCVNCSPWACHAWAPSIVPHGHLMYGLPQLSPMGISCMGSLNCPRWASHVWLPQLSTLGISCII